MTRSCPFKCVVIYYVNGLHYTTHELHCMLTCNIIIIILFFYLSCSVLHEGPNLQTPDVEKTDLIDFNTPENNASVVELNTPDLVHLPKNRKAKILSKLSKSLVTFDSPNANIVKKNLSASVICLDTPVKTSESPFKTPSLPIRSSVKKKLLENKLSHTLQETPDFKSRLSSTPVETRSILKSDCTPERHLDRSRKSLRFASAEHDVSNEDFKDLCGSTPIAPSKYQKSVIQELSQVPEDDSNGCEYILKYFHEVSC